jgi:hypothetical protein
VGCITAIALGVSAKQKREVQPNRERLIKILLSCKDGPTRGKEPEKWGTESRPLYAMNELEMADLRLKQGQVDAIEIQNSVVTPEEIAVSRHGGQRWQSRTVLDFEAREAVKQAPDEPAPPDVQPPAAPPVVTEGTGEPDTGEQTPEAV